jgi:hypothetical protein
MSPSTLGAAAVGYFQSVFNFHGFQIHRSDFNIAQLNESATLWALYIHSSTDLPETGYTQKSFHIF